MARKSLGIQLVKAVIRSQYFKILVESAVFKSLQIVCPGAVIVDIQLSHNELGIHFLDIAFDGGGCIHR